MIKDIQEEDLQNIIYYRDGFAPGDAGEFVARKITDSTSTLLSLSNDAGVILSPDRHSPIEPSISSDGRYIAAYVKPGNASPATINVPDNIFGIYSFQESAIVQRVMTKIPCYSHQYASYPVPWSQVGHSYYVIASDTIKKCYPDGKQVSVMYIENLTYFSISPSERWLLFAQKDRVGLYDLERRLVFRVKEFETLLGVEFNHCVRSVAWSPDEMKVAFAEGHRFIIFNVSSDQIAGHVVVSDIFALEWASDDELVYVEGYQPYENEILKGDPYFKIFSYSLSSNINSLLHKRESHEPVSIKPKRSPSGKHLLFAEKQVLGGYQVKLLGIDGKNMQTLWNGYNPVWGR